MRRQDGSLDQIYSLTLVTTVSLLNGNLFPLHHGNAAQLFTENATLWISLYAVILGTPFLTNASRTNSE